MKPTQIFLVASLFVCVVFAAPWRQYCLEEMRQTYGNNTAIIERRYAETGENVCFDLKMHVSKCLDKALWSFISVTDRKQVEEFKKTKVPPSITLDDLKEALGNYINIGKIPGFNDFLMKCSHPTLHSGIYKNAITVGDFSRKCACDLGSSHDCMAYERIRQSFGCGNVVSVPKMM